MSDLTLKVSTTRATSGICLLATLGNGISASCAPSFGNLTPVLLSTLTDNSFTLPVGFSGRVYFFLTSDLSKVPTQAADLSTTLALRYDWIEATYDGTTTAAANLTSVDQLGIALSLKTLNASGHTIQSVGYKSTLNSIVGDFVAAAPKAVSGTLASATDPFLRVISPLHTATGVWVSLQGYLTALSSSTLNIVGPYDGSIDANGVAHPASSFNYTCDFKYDDAVTEITLTANSSSLIKGTITLAKADLEAMIYACDGNFDVAGKSAGPNGNGTNDKVGFNDPWSTVVRNFLVGFNLGFYGYKPAPVDGYHYNGSNSWDWAPELAFKNTLATTSYNKYASLIYDNSNSYGFPFSDFLGKPLVQLYGAASVQIDILADDAVNADYAIPEPPNIKPVTYTDPTTRNPVGLKAIAVVLNGGVGQPTYYTGTMTFSGTTCTFGQGVFLDNSAPTFTTAPGNCTINAVFCSVGSTMKYSMTIEGKPFNLYMTLDAAGLITKAVVDGGLISTVDILQQNVTISNILNYIKPQ
jgi:hypothetical protein